MKSKVLAVIAFSLIVSLTYAAGNAPQPTICNRACWNARSATCNPNLDNNFLARAIIHHTAAASDYDINNLEEGKVKMRAKQNYYLDVKQYCDTGYNFLVDRLGNIYEGRVRSINQTVRGSHALYFNNNSFGFSFFGYFHPPYNHPTPAAMRNAMYDLVAWRMPNPFTGYGAAWYNAPTVGNTYYGYIDGHRTVATQTTNTSCPGDGIWQYMGTNYNGGEMRNSINQRIVGSNINVVIDNSSPYFSASSNWILTSYASDKYGADYRYRSTAAVSDQATWIYGIDGNHTLKLYMWWPAGTNRAPSASYNFSHAGGRSTVAVNQQINGGKWNLLSQSLIANGLNDIKLSCWTTSGFVVMADAFRYTNQ